MFISCSALHTVNIYNNIIHTNTLGDSANKSSFKKPGMPGLKFLMGNPIFATFFCMTCYKNNNNFMTIRIVLELVSIYTHL